MDIESIEARITKCEEDIKISTTVQIRPMSIRQKLPKNSTICFMSLAVCVSQLRALKANRESVGKALL